MALLDMACSQITTLSLDDPESKYKLAGYHSRYWKAVVHNCVVILSFLFLDRNKQSKKKPFLFTNDQEYPQIIEGQLPSMGVSLFFYVLFSLLLGDRPHHLAHAAHERETSVALASWICTFRPTLPGLLYSSVFWALSHNVSVSHYYPLTCSGCWPGS